MRKWFLKDNVFFSYVDLDTKFNTSARKDAPKWKKHSLANREHCPHWQRSRLGPGNTERKSPVKVVFLWLPFPPSLPLPRCGPGLRGGCCELSLTCLASGVLLLLPWAPATGGQQVQLGLHFFRSQLLIKLFRNCFLSKHHFLGVTERLSYFRNSLAHIFGECKIWRRTITAE